MSDREVWLAKSIFGAATKQGLVEVIVRGQHLIITPQEARDFAMSLLQAAEGAEADEILFHFFTETLGITVQQFGQMLNDFRTIREKMWRDAALKKIVEDGQS